MICQTLPYNENDHVRITKSGCYDYTFENKTECSQTVTITRLTNGSIPYSAQFVLEPMGTYNIRLPGDGMYSVVGTGGCAILNVTDTVDIVPLVMHIALFDIGVKNVGDAITLVRDTTNAIDVYNSGVDGVSTLGAPANMITALTNYGIGTGQAYVANMFAPGQVMTGGWNALYADTTGYRLLVGYIGGAVVNRWTVDGVNYSPTVRACAYFIPTTPPGYIYATSAIVNGIEQVSIPSYYDLTVQEQFDNYRSLIVGALSNYGTSFNVPGPDELGGIILNEDVTECPDIELTLAQGELIDIEIGWCTTLWEWCRIWNCLQTKMREWLCCNDPCAPHCPNPPTGDKWLDDVMRLTVWGIMPLLQEHHMWQFANLHDDQVANLSRLQPTILLWDRWYKLVENCGCPSGKLCAPCGESGAIMASTVTMHSPMVIGTNNGGCGCG